MIAPSVGRAARFIGGLAGIAVVDGAAGDATTPTRAHANVEARTRAREIGRMFDMGGCGGWANAVADPKYHLRTGAHKLAVGTLALIDAGSLLLHSAKGGCARGPTDGRDGRLMPATVAGHDETRHQEPPAPATRS